MRPIARSLALALSASLLTGPSPASARGPALEATAAAVEAAARSGSLSAAMRAALDAIGAEARPMSHAPAILPPGLPGTLRAPLADLLGALRAADATARASLRATGDAIDREAAEATALLDEALTDPAPGLRIRARAHRSRIGRMIDGPALRGAAAAVAEAIDRAIPTLLAVRGSLPARDDAGCDVVEQAGVLCVAGPGASTITGEYALVVDLGGDDTHLHSAGGASALANGLAAAVTIDLDGDDVYETRVGEDTASLGAQGAGRSGGIGMLVDQAGNDRYSITSNAPEFTQIIGHGASVLGVGVLADRAGHDAYSIVNAQPSTATHAQGQGFSVLGVLGMFLDTGQGNDTIADDASPVPLVGEEGEVLASRARAECCGSAAGATVAVYVDDGGTDASEVTGTSALVGPGTPDQAVATSHGLAGLGGLAISTTGLGDTERGVTATSAGPAAGTATVALGAEAALGGLSVSSDAGGDDVYRGVARSLARDDVILTDGCACERRATALSGQAVAGGLAFGSLGASVEQLDASGNDRYELVAESVAGASVVDQRVHPEGAVVALPSVDAESGRGRSAGLGYGAAAATARFVDAAGDDRYVVSGDSAATASSAPDAPGFVHDASSLGGLADAEALGAGFGDLGGAAPGTGHFQDLGGVDDYVVAMTSAAATEPSGPAFDGGTSASVLGSVEQNAVATFLDEGGADSVSLVPADPACEGERGVDTWRDCGTVLGAGSNRI